MDIRYYDEEKFIGAQLFRDADGSIFESIANQLTEVFHVRWKTKIDGFDQRYWDFEYKGITLTLHLEHFAGISILFNKSIVQDEESKHILAELGDHFKVWNPTQWI